MYYRVTFNTMILVTTSLSGGLFHFIFDDINKVYVRKIQYFPTPLNYPGQLINTGFFIGFGLGLSYIMTGKPLVDNLLI